MGLPAMPRGRIVHAGLIFCTLVFMAGFVLGVLRISLVAPLAGALPAVALEAPALLAILWASYGWITERLDLSSRLVDRLMMGGGALAMLIAAEAAAAMLALGYSLQAFFAYHSRSAVLLGLMAQLAFALFPLFKRKNGS